MAQLPVGSYLDVSDTNLNLPLEAIATNSATTGFALSVQIGVGYNWTGSGLRSWSDRGVCQGYYPVVSREFTWVPVMLRKRRGNTLEWVSLYALGARVVPLS